MTLAFLPWSANANPEMPTQLTGFTRKAFHWLIAAFSVSAAGPSVIQAAQYQHATDQPDHHVVVDPAQIKKILEAQKGKAVQYNPNLEGPDDEDDQTANKILDNPSITVDAISNILNYGRNIACFKDTNGTKFIIEDKNGLKSIYQLKDINGIQKLTLADKVVQPNISANDDYRFTDSDGSLVFYNHPENTYKRLTYTQDANGIVSYSLEPIENLGINSDIFELNGKKIYSSITSRQFFDNKNAEGTPLRTFDAILDRFQVINYTINGVEKEYLAVGTITNKKVVMYLMDENGNLAEENGKKIDLIELFPSLIDFSEFNIYKNSKGEHLMAIKEITEINADNVVTKYAWSVLNLTKGEKYNLIYTGTQSTSENNAFKSGAPTVVEEDDGTYAIFTDGVRSYTFKLPDATNTTPSWSPTLTTIIQGLNTAEDAAAKTIDLATIGANIDPTKLTFSLSPSDLGTLTYDPATKKLTFVPNANANGTGNVTVKHAGLADQVVPITVDPVNDAPVLGAEKKFW
ncbi:MAG TPA: hypothetical protein PLO56_16315 [Rhodothermales bacterium]|nr:hypothetical protein [Rhodothermales bacterium]